MNNSPPHKQQPTKHPGDGIPFGWLPLVIMLAISLITNYGLPL